MQEAGAKIRQQPSEADVIPFLTDAILWFPKSFDLPSTWYEHVPFAFWIIEALRPACFVELGTHYGLSYLAFCQAIDKLRLPTRAYAVDTWKGDEHAGFYGEEVFSNLTALHDTNYASFSRLVRATFDEAVDHFADGSIDLLHIDGLHTYEAVKHDFETWRQKLASCAVVLFHDTNVRERSFGVWKLWRELAEAHPHFEFLHGHGLGVLGVGSRFPAAISALFAASDKPQSQRYGRDCFARLGAQVSLQARLGRTADHLSAEIAARDRRIAELMAGISARDARIADLNSTVAAHAAERERWAAEVGARDRRIAELLAGIFARDARIADLNSSVRDARIASSAREGRIADLNSTLAAHAAECERWAAEASARDVRICGLEQSLHAEQAACQVLMTRTTTQAVQLHKIKRSASWRITRPLRWPLVRKPRKRLRRAWKKMLRWSPSPSRRGRADVNEGNTPAAEGVAEISTAPEVPAELPVSVEPKAPSRPRIVFLSGEPNTPGHYYRIENIRGALAPRFFETTIIPIDELSMRASEIDGAGVLWIWRTSWTDAIEHAVTRARLGGARIVFDVDDLMFMPEIATADTIDGIRTQNLTEEEVRQGFARVREVLVQADHCLGPTIPLVQRMRWQFKPATVMPNGFDRRLLVSARQARVARERAADDGWIRIGYASGSRTHQRDFAVASRAIADALSAHPRVRLVLFEHTIDIMEFPELAPFADRIEWRPLVSLLELPNEYARFDINIAPLEVGNPFCEAKSELKFFEAALAGVITIASPTRPFRDSITHGETGFLASDEADWRRCLGTLIEDPALRRRMADKAYNYALWHYGPERRTMLVNRLVARLLAPPGLAADLARPPLPDAGPTEVHIDIPEYSIVYASERRRISRVSVVIPLFNYAHYVKDALESVKQQTVDDVDLIVVEDCSTDNSLAVARSWLVENSARFNRAVLLQNRNNAKLARTRNVGIAYADTEFVLPLDADNQLLPACLERCIAILDDTQAAMAYPTIEMFGDDCGLITEENWDPGLLQCGNYIDAMAMFSKASWLAVGGYGSLELGWEDFDLWCKFVEAGFWGVRVPEVIARYRVHGSSMLRTLTDLPENRRRVAQDLTIRHPWLDLPEQPASSS